MAMEVKTAVWSRRSSLKTTIDENHTTHYNFQRKQWPFFKEEDEKSGKASTIPDTLLRFFHPQIDP